MPKKITIEIKESIEFLEEKILELKDSLELKDVLKRDRIETLLCIKERELHFQSDIAKKIGRTEKTIRSWIQEYSKNGYRGLLKEKRGGNNNRKMSKKAVKHISEFAKMISIFIDTSFEIKMFPSEKPSAFINFGASSFIELQSQFERKLGETIEYDALLSHFRRNHKEELDFLRLYFPNKRKIKKS